MPHSWGIHCNLFYTLPQKYMAMGAWWSPIARGTCTANYMMHKGDLAVYQPMSYTGPSESIYVSVRSSMAWPNRAPTTLILMQIRDAATIVQDLVRFHPTTVHTPRYVQFYLCKVEQNTKRKKTPPKHKVRLHLVQELRWERKWDPRYKFLSWYCFN